MIYTEQVNEYRQELSDRVVSKLEQQQIPWQLPTSSFNPANNAAYSGINRLNLAMAAQDKGYEDPRWCSFKQANENGWKIKAGEKGTRIEWWQYSEKRSITGEDGKQTTETVRLTQPRCLIYTVFNAEQIEGMPPLIWPPVLPKGHNPINREAWDNIIANPNPIKEILMEEMANCFASHDIGMTATFPNTNATIQEWITILRNDKNEIFNAAYEASKASAYLLEFNKEKEQTKQEEQAPKGESYVAKTDIRLNVPYEERETARELGAKWDKDKRAWFIPKGADVSIFQQQEGWLPADGTLPALRQTPLHVSFEDKEQAKMLGAHWKDTAKSWVLPAGTDSRAIPDKFYEAPKQQERIVEKSFETFAAEMGVIIVGEAIADGQLHRVAVEGGKPKAKDGAYLLHDDANGRSGYVQNFKTGEKATFGEKSAEKVVTPKSKEELEQIKTARNEEIKHTQDEAAKKADYLVKSVFKPAETHKYLETKGIEPHGALIENSGALVVSLQNIKGEIRSFQRIEEDGRKVFITGGQKQGCFHAIGQLEGAKQILICEGFATGASLNEATGKPIVCAMDAGNLKTVALAIKEKYGEAELIIAGDNDHKADKNLGKQAAEEAAKACGGKAVIPQFTPAQMAKGCTDFNDLAKDEGKLAVRKQISEATKEQSKETAKSHDKDRSM